MHVLANTHIMPLDHVKHWCFYSEVLLSIFLEDSNIILRPKAATTQRASLPSVELCEECTKWKECLPFNTHVRQKHTHLPPISLTGTYYVHLAGCGFMLRRCHCTWASLTHAIPLSHGRTHGVFPSVTDVRVLFSRQSRT